MTPRSSKDTERLPRLYVAAGIPELWLADARGSTPSLEIHRLAEAGYEPVQPDARGWTASPCLSLRVRLRRDEDPSGLCFFRLEVRAEG